MKWIIIGSPVDPLYRKRIGTGNATPEEAKVFKQRWRTLDTDGEVSFRGVSDCVGFAPLDDFCRAEVGDIEIQFCDEHGIYHAL